MRKCFNGILLVPFFILSLSLQAQVNSISPYTKIGLGDLFKGDYARGIGIGGASLGIYDPLNINFKNPASYSALELSTFDVGFEFSAYKLEQQDPYISQDNNNAGLRYFSFGLPVYKKWWGSAIGLQPYSFKGYDISVNRSFQDSIRVTDKFKGSGGLNQVFWGNSFEVAKGLSLGVNAAFIFGKMEEVNFTFWDRERFLNIQDEEIVQVRGFHLNYGAQYHYVDSTGRSYGIGITYSNSNNIHARVGKYQYLFAGNIENHIPLDSLASSGVSNSEIKLPGRLGIGLSFGKFDSIILNHAWLVAADLELNNTGDYVHYDGSTPMINSYRIEAGSLIRPRWAFESLKRKTSYFLNVEYRLGGFYEKTPYQVAGYPIHDYGITFGLGLPVRHRSLAPGEQKVSTINTGIVLGRRGTTENGLIQESYINFYLGLTLNDKWFIKYRYR